MTISPPDRPGAGVGMGPGAHGAGRQLTRDPTAASAVTAAAGTPTSPYVVGSLAFGAVAEWANVQTAFALAGVAALAGAVAGLGPLALPDLSDVSPVRYWPDPDLAMEPEPRAGPVLVIVEWRIDPDHAAEFAETMQPVGRARRQTGATR
jgi:hypothetical protein